MSEQETGVRPGARGVAERRPSLELGTVDIASLIALHAGRARTSRRSPSSSSRTCSRRRAPSSSPRPIRSEARHPRDPAAARAAAARARRWQGVVRTGEFALSRLASGIVEFYLEEDVLTRASLTLLSTTPAHSAAADVAAARGCERRTTSRLGERVRAAPGHDRRAGRRHRAPPARARSPAGGLPARDPPAARGDWFGALDRCQALLESTSATLHELNEVCCATRTRAARRCSRISRSSPPTAARARRRHAAHRLMDQIDRIVAWGAARQRAWSEYFQYVHRYLRDVVRLDPTRALTQRLREQLAGSGRRFALTTRRRRRCGCCAPCCPCASARRCPAARAARARAGCPSAAVDPQAAARRAGCARARRRRARRCRTVTDGVTPRCRRASASSRRAGSRRHGAQLARVRRRARAAVGAAGGEIEVEEWTSSQRVPATSQGRAEDERGQGLRELQDVIAATPSFPALDLALRRGRHIDREDFAWYTLLTRGAGSPRDVLSPLRLRARAQGRRLLLPAAERRQAVAPPARAPATCSSGRRSRCCISIRRRSSAAAASRSEEVVAQLVAVLGSDALVRALLPRRQAPATSSVAQKLVRSQDRRGDPAAGRAGLRRARRRGAAPAAPALLRFAEPVRGLAEPAEALAKLVAQGEVDARGSRWASRRTRRARASSTSPLESQDAPEPTTAGAVRRGRRRRRGAKRDPSARHCARARELEGRVLRALPARSARDRARRRERRGQDHGDDRRVRRAAAGHVAAALHELG